MKSQDTSKMLISVQGIIMIALSLLVGCALIGLGIHRGMSHLANKPRVVFVKGLAEQKVIADKTVWSIPFLVASDDLDQGHQKLDTDVKKLVELLNEYGINESDIHYGTIHVRDRNAERYYDKQNTAKRYHLEYQIVIKSEKVQQVKEASANLNKLIRQGISLSYEDGYGYDSMRYAPRYFFTKLNEIKPEMLKRAMQASKEAANEIVADSNDSVGYAQKVMQGAFSIYSQEAIAGASYSQTDNEAYFIDKIVRVVISAEYVLTNKGYTS